MIPIRLYRTFWESIALSLGNIAHTLFVRTEDELSKKIKDVADGDLVLIAVIPSADTNALNHDNIREHEIAIIYILVKVNRNNMNENDLVDAQEKTQQKIKRVKQVIMAEADDCDAVHHLLCRDIDLSRMHVDPEYNFLGCDGYSLSLQFNTTGF